jgi:hypothetical protein
MVIVLSKTKIDKEKKTTYLVILIVKIKYIINENKITFNLILSFNSIGRKRNKILKFLNV